MSFLYPRTVSISRPGVQAGVGAQPYGGLVPASETSIATGLPASIQTTVKAYRNNEESLPSDAGITMWSIFVPRTAAALGLIAVRDVITDDLGQRYQVIAPYYNSLGHKLLVKRLET